MYKIKERTIFSDQVTATSYPRAIRNILAGIIVSLFFVCQFFTSTQSQTIITTPRKIIKAVIEIQLKLLKNGKLVVFGKTNLPNNTQFMVHLDKAFRDGGWDSSVRVKNYMYSSGEFTNGGQAMSKGEYTARIIVVMAALQPDNVKAIIGENFKYLTGPLVKSTNGSRDVNAVKTFEIR
jgi:hypothetical protein